uniref:Catharanthine synthase n=1 Tax=Catharanthus roseus TaxID=4058 RepID=CS_CATRO|nr:RecName: Full=Catharanthine synthase; AltName: Full=Hydrolase 1; Short=CrHL1 [Catharanthus roseus]AVM85920.1 hydrolase 1 [Catharanthus roseus]
MNSSTDPTSDETIWDLSPYIKIFKDGRVERLHNSPYVPPSLNDPETGVSWKDVPISSQVSARVYIPKISDHEKLPIFVYVHGAGFCLESAFRSFFHTFVKHFVAETKVIGVSIEYRLAPEHLLPAAYEDCWEALQWVASHVGLDNSGLKTAIDKDPWIINYGDFDRLYLAGDSPGANIVHNTLIRAGKEKLKGGVKILGAILYYPYFIIPTSTKLSDDFEYNYTCYWKLAYPNAPGGMNNPMINPIAENAPDLAGYGCSRLLVTLVSMISTTPDETKDINAVYIEALEKSGWKGELEVADFDADYFELFTLETEMGKNMFRRLASFIKHE